MDFETTPEQETFRRDFRDWLFENLPNGWLDGDRSIPDNQKARVEFLRDWHRKQYEGGWKGIAWPEEYGGQDASLMEQVIYDQELARVDAPPEVNPTGMHTVGPTLIEVGTDEQKERFLPPILKCDEIWCQGYSEPGSGSDLASLQTKAEDQGDQFLINGQKIWTSGAHFADWCFLLARTDPSGDKHHGITALLVDMDQEGVTAEPIRSLSDEYHFNQVFFDDAIAMKEHVVGDVDEGWGVAMTLSRFERTSSAAFTLERRWKEIATYCRNHTRNGQLLIQDPLVRQQLGELDTKIQAAKLTYLRNISKQIKTGKPPASGLMDNVYSRELKQELESFALSLKGIRAGLWESGSVADKHPRYRLRSEDATEGWWTEEYLDSLPLTIGGGTSDIKRNLIAERVLDLPKGLRKE